jgi:hypothetical protein
VHSEKVLIKIFRPFEKYPSRDTVPLRGSEGFSGRSYRWERGGALKNYSDGLEDWESFLVNIYSYNRIGNIKGRCLLFRQQASDMNEC